jgi:hypothetical protein
MCYSVKKKLFTVLPYLLICVLSVTSFCAIAQIDPFALTPIWHFGNRAGLDFTSGSPVLLGGGQVNGGGQEGSSSICDPSGTLVFYSDGFRLYDAGHTFMQNLNGGTSSTQNSVIIPDPADPSNRFYLFTANVDHNGAGDKPASNASLGIHYYHIQKNAGSILVLSGPVQIASHAEVSEQLCSGTDGNGNYWVVAHEGGHFDWQMNEIWAWKITTAGVGTKVTSTIAGKTGNNPWQGSLKINKCQTKLAAVYSTGVVEIFDWNASTGQVTAMPQRITGLPAAYGCEFSPDGSILYYTSLGGNMLYQLDIASGTIYSDATWTSSNNSPEVGTMQLGPDNRIYVLNGSNFAVPCYLGVINNPNVPGAGCNYVKTGLTLNSGPGSYPNVQRGISNIAWLSPQGTLNITNSSCPAYSFSYTLQSYFLDNISIVPNSEEWDFGDGAGFQSGLGPAPSHVYAGNGTYTVRVRLRDVTCNRTWMFSNQISPNCVLPVEWIYLNATQEHNSVLVSWATASEEHNSHFIIDRSVDGIHFEAIGRVESKNNSSSITEYLFSDLNPLEGKGYYRIRQVDIDGATTHSAIVAVTTPTSSIIIAPNPASGEYTLYMPEQTTGTLRVYDLSGKEILSSEIYPGFQFGKTFSPGTYIVKIIIKEQSYCEKLIKDN